MLFGLFFLCYLVFLEWAKKHLIIILVILTPFLVFFLFFLVGSTSKNPKISNIYIYSHFSWGNRPHSWVCSLACASSSPNEFFLSTLFFLFLESSSPSLFFSFFILSKSLISPIDWSSPLLCLAYLPNLLFKPFNTSYNNPMWIFLVLIYIQYLHYKSKII